MLYVCQNHHSVIRRLPVREVYRRHERTPVIVCTLCLTLNHFVEAQLPQQYTVCSTVPYIVMFELQTKKKEQDYQRQKTTNDNGQ